MWIVLFFVCCTSLLEKGFGFGNEDFLGKGRWLVLNVLECEAPEQYEVQVELTRKKINRTHDAFSIYADLDRVFDFTYGIDLIAKKEVDGGFKFYQQITDGSFCKICKKYLGNNWIQLLTKANVNPPECPIPVGELRIDDYVVDYSELRETGMYGKYDVCVYITYMGRRLACGRVLVQFEKQHEEDDDYD